MAERPQWKAPNRPENEISQTFNDGVVTVYGIADAAEPGRKPLQELRWKVKLCYDERRLGLARLWTGQQAQTQYERVLRVPRAAAITPQDVAVIAGSGAQYRINLVQTVPDVRPACVDLTLSRIAQGYPLPQEDGDTDG